MASTSPSTPGCPPGSRAPSSLRCALLLTRGEILEAEADIGCLGYAVEGYPSTQDTSCLRDSVPCGQLDYFMSRWRDLNTPYVRSLRSSFARMLTDLRWDGDDFIIFGESDATPVTEAAALRQALERELAEHPETDVFRLFHHKTVAAEEKPTAPEQFLFSPYLTASRTKGSLYVWGTHAIVVPAASRRKVAKLFLDNMLPIDNALEMAASRGELNVRVAGYNHFYQRPRTRPHDRTVSYAWRRRRIAVCLCVRNLPHLDRLAAWFLAEPYAESHLLVAVKGITEPVFRKFAEGRWHSAIEDGRLTVRLFPEKNPGSDLLDACRDTGADDYHLYLMLRETDAPAPGFLETLNAFHAVIPQDYSGYYKGEAWEFTPDGLPIRKDEACGTGTCFSLTRETFLALREWENAPEPEPCGGDGEDLLFRLVTRYGRKNMAPFLEKGLASPLLVYPAVARSGVVSGKADPLAKVRQESRMFFRNREAEWEYVLELWHPVWRARFRVLGKDGCRVSSGDHTSILEFTGDVLRVKWDKWGVECFVRDGDGFFCLEQESSTAGESKPELSTVTEGKKEPGGKEKPEVPQQAVVVAGTEKCGNGKSEKALPPLPEVDGERRGVCTLARKEDTPEGLRDWITVQLKAGASVVAVFLPESGAQGASGTGTDGMKAYLDDLAQKYGRERVWIRPWKPLPLRGHDLAAMLEDEMQREDEGLEECVFLERGCESKKAVFSPSAQSCRDRRMNMCIIRY